MEGDQYEHESEAEDYVDYGPQGYHPVELNQKFNQGKYTVVQKLGWGHFSTVWLVHKHESNQYLALKIQRSKESHAESALDQMQILEQVRVHENDPEWTAFLEEYSQAHPDLFKPKLCRPLLLLDKFVHFGIHGKHMCSVFELMGPNLLDVIQHYEFSDKRMPLWLVKKIARDTLMGLVYLHERCNIIHTDLKPQNIMIKMESYEEQELIQQLKSYTVKPLSMKFLRNLQASKNPKNKKKLEKKKLKKKKAQEENGDKEKEQESVQQQSSERQEASEVSEISALSSSVQSPSDSSVTPRRQEPIPVDKSESMEEEPSSSNQPNSSSTPCSSVNQSESHKQAVQQQDKEEDWQDMQEGVDMSILKWKSVNIKLNNKLFFKIADMGNACFTHKHFTEDIQTRQYRSPEVLLGHDYSCNTDIFSLACTIYEMMTNNFLFKPKKISGIKKNEDHMYQMLETLGNIDKEYAINGRYSGQIFNKKGKLLNGNPKKIVPISKRLVEKYGYEADVAVAAEEFLLPMLAFEPKFRIDARSCLHSKWLWT